MSGLEMEEENEKLSSSTARVIHTTTKQVISSRRKGENGNKVYQNKKARAKRAKLLFSYYLNTQICDVLVAVVVA